MSTNEKDYRIFGLKRSGNHMVIGSIISSFDDGEVFFINDIRTPRTPLTGSRPKTTRCYLTNKDKIFMGNLTSKLVSAEKYTLPVFRNNRKVLIQSYEDFGLSAITEINKQDIGKSEHYYNVIILRDPYNWIASRIKLKQKIQDISVDNQIIDLWKQYAREFLGETNILGEQKVCVNYNKFIIDQNYQKEICDMLGIAHEKMSLDHQLNFGFGSSFTGLEKSDPSSYNNRYKNYNNHPIFKMLISDPLVKEYSEKIFNFSI